MANRMPTWAETIEAVHALRVAVREARRRDGLSLREAAGRSGLSFTSLQRFEHGGDIQLSNAVALMVWLDSPAALRGDPT